VFLDVRQTWTAITVKLLNRKNILDTLKTRLEMININSYVKEKVFSQDQTSVTVKMTAWLLLLMLLPTTVYAAANLEVDDFVGISFWLISMALMASTVFFLWETQGVTAKWKTSLVVSALVTLIASVHYFYMRDVWIETQTTPTVYRYIDWLLTVPLLMIEFYLILRAIGVASAGIFWRLLIGTLVMLVPGYMSEAGYLNIYVGFTIGMLGWFYILYEIFLGEAGKAAEAGASEAVMFAYKSMRWIVTLGWAIYPAGYVLGYMTGSVDESSLNIIYNFADLVNKIAFGLLIWYAATSESQTAPLEKS
jgi:hypothetical protein